MQLMTTRKTIAATGLAALLLAGACTGGSETKAAEDRPTQNAPAAGAVETKVNAAGELARINPAIPLYQGAEFRDDLTRRDQVMIRNQYGPNAEVYTLASDDSFPQVYHYYTTYLAQFRAFPAQETYPPEQKNWRTLEVQLNQAMQDPFIPGEALDPSGKQVVLQVTETEAEPKTLIRYIVTDAPVAAPAPVATAENSAQPGPVAR